jgi:hypothetical protein
MLDFRALSSLASLQSPDFDSWTLPDDAQTIIAALRQVCVTLSRMELTICWGCSAQSENKLATVT